MKRWNGWGDDATTLELNAQALAFLRSQIGPGTAPVDATLPAVCAALPPSRLPPHPLVSTDAATRLANSLGQSLPDWLQLRHGRVQAVSDGVAFPESDAQVRELLAYARTCGAAVIPVGGATSVVGHLTVPLGPRPVLNINLTRMGQLLDLDSDARLATFGAGVTGPDLEAQLRAQGYTLGHFPQSFEYSTLGGWVVTRSSGQQSRGFGRMEQLFAGGRMETPAGTLDLPSFPASAAGPDLREWVLGSEGRMGVLTQATVRIVPLPQAEVFHAVFFPDWATAQTAVRALAQSAVPLSMLRLSNPLETWTTLAMAGHPRLMRALQAYLALRGCQDEKCLLLLGASGDRAAVQQALAGAHRIARAHQGVPLGAALGTKWKQNRFRNVYLRNTLWAQGYAIDTVETACDWGRVTPMMHAVEAAARQALDQDGERVHAYTHLSHLYAQGASVYSTFVYRLSGDYATDLARWQRLKAAACQAIVAQGGTISHQHGVGVDHAPYLAAEKGALGVTALGHLFTAFDPQGCMNPGKLVGTP